MPAPGLDPLALDATQLITLADRLNAEQRFADVAALYRAWLLRNNTPLNYIIQFNLGVTLSSLEQLPEAEVAYRAAIMQKTDFVQAWFNLGSVMERTARAENALRVWQSMLDHPLVGPELNRELYLMVLNAMGRLQEEQREFEAAEAHLRASLECDPEQPKVIQHWVHLRQKQCKWPIYDAIPGLTPGQMLKATSPLAMLSVSDDTGLQLATAVRFAHERIDQRVAQLAPPRGYAHPKLRIGFLSSDFCLHAVSILTVELFELMDRERFELYGFCWSREDGSAMRQRVIAAMDHFILIKTLDDKAAAECIRTHEIDILFDLQGLTSGARPNILAYRPAPVHIAYLGFPGTTGMPAIDHVVVDRFLLPDAERPYYSEAPLYLPKVYQSCDRQRPVGAIPTRAACGLPEKGFVFCSFNNNYKFSDEVFDCWLRILARVPDSVLWLLADNKWAERHLRAHAARRGIDGTRLLFAPRVAPADYLARYTAADLFLDTFPFNGGTTANDALWMGLPVLTRSGRAFASRMAGSLLTALELPELITTSLADYEEQAVRIGNDGALYAALKQRLVHGKTSAPLFDMPQFVRDFEDALRTVAIVSA
jgi:predicted O-linked N-acetylglucosamine transferase (SPINDLY family)